MMHDKHRAPHHLRFATFVLRVVLGAYLFTLGFTNATNAYLPPALRKQAAAGSILHWLSASGNIATALVALKWIFIVAGIALAVGLATRLIAIFVIVVVGFFYVQSIRFPATDIVELANSNLVVIAALLVLAFSKAGAYLGLDKFFHFSLRGKK